MNGLFLVNTAVFSLVSVFIVYAGNNGFTKTFGIPFGVLAMYNLVTYLQLVFPTVNWI